MKICESNTFYNAYEAIVREIKLNRHEDSLSGGFSLRHILIVPDEFTMNVERGILTSLKISGAFDVEVTSFRRLARKFLGDELSACLSPQGAVMLLAGVISDCADKLVYFRHSARSISFAPDMYAALTAVRNSGLSSADIREVAAKSDGAMKRKLSDVALLYEHYMQALSGRADSGTVLQAFAAYLREQPNFPYYVYVCDFDSFSSPRLNILSALAEKSISLMVSLVTNKLGDNKRLYPNENVRIISDYARKNGVACTTFDCYEKLTPYQYAVAHNMYSFNGAPPVEIGDAVELVKLRDVQEEAEFVAKSIRKLVVQGKCRYKDVAIVAGNIEEYASVFKRVFKRMEIPFFIDQKELLVDQVGVRLVLSALSVVKDGFSALSVLEYAHNPLLRLNCERFSDYVQKYNIDRSRFLAPFVLGECGELAAAEDIREKLVQSLSAFIGKKRMNGVEFSECIREFFQTVDFDNRLKETVEAVAEDSPFYADCLEQVGGKLSAVTEELTSIFSQTEMDFSEYCEVFANALASLKVSLIPVFVDTVFVGEMGESRYADIKYLFVVGAAEGVVPRGASGAGTVLTERDEEAFAFGGHPLFESRGGRLKRELFYLIQLLVKPTAHVCISYADVGRAGEIMRPSSLFSEFQSLFLTNGVPPVLSVVSEGYRGLSDEAAAEKCAFNFATKENMFFELLATDTFARDARFAAAYGLLSDDRKKLVDRELIDMPPSVPSEFLSDKSSVSEFESYFGCPYRHFLSYRLCLNEKEESRLDALKTGIVIHSFLERFMRAVVSSDKGFSSDVARLSAFAEEAFSAVMSEEFPYYLANPDNRTAIELLREECVSAGLELASLQLRSTYTPRWFEVKIGNERINPLKIPYSGGTLYFSGRIDRVDERKNNLVVIDYKSGGAGADFSNRALYMGKKIQLHLYADALLSAWKDKTIRGVFYLSVSDKYKKDESVRFAYHGHATENIDELCEIDSGTPEKSTNRLPVTVTKNAVKNGLTEKEFRAVFDYVEKLLSNAADEIKNGNIQPLPTDGECKYCAYSSMCQYVDKYVRMTTALPSQIVFFEEEAK